ncbi:MAG: STAS domain-containing protein [Actinomycetes bacterium]
MSDLARLELHAHGAVLHATLTGEIDMSNAAALERRIVDAATGLGAILLDLTSVTFIDSAGVRLLDHLVAPREPNARVRVVIGPSGPVPFTLRLCGFRDDLLADSVESALAELGDD